MLQFVDCPNCGKRVRVNAVNCHRCGHSLSQTATQQKEIREGAPEFAEGGYTSEDDFDYDEYAERQFQNRPPIRKIWYYTAWIVLIALLVPWLLQLMAVI